MSSVQVFPSRDVRAMTIPTKVSSVRKPARRQEVSEEPAGQGEPKEGSEEASPTSEDLPTSAATMEAQAKSPPRRPRQGRRKLEQVLE